MRTYQKKSGRRVSLGRGRPQHSASQKDESRTRRRRDGERLAAALEEKGLSQAEVARRTGIAESNVSLIVHGNRDLNREDFRRLAGLGISADYLLGVTDIVEPGGTRRKVDLADDLANLVWREARAAIPRRTGMKWPLVLQPEQLVPRLVEQVRLDLESWEEYNSQREAAFETMKDLFLLVESGGADAASASDAADRRIERIVRMALPRPPETELVVESIRVEGGRRKSGR